MSVQAPFNKTVWKIPAGSITGFTVSPGSLGAVDVTIHSTVGVYQAEMVTKQNFEKLQALFPHLETDVGGKKWYRDPVALTHVETYTDQKKMQQEVEAAGQFGWIPQTSAAVGSHVNVGRTASAAALTGGISLLFGASRSKEKITITFARSQSWLDQHK